MELKEMHDRVREQDDREKAANAYVMSLVALMAGLPLPIVNLLATFIFFMANRKSSYFVRWHCTQALLSQFFVFVLNTISFQWTLRILFGNLEFSNEYFGYLCVVILVNIAEIIGTLVSAVKVRKGKESNWWLFAPLTDVLVRKES
jgi:uncharacterized Tic20 family protein